MKNFLITSGLNSSWKLSKKNYLLNYFTTFQKLNRYKNKEFVYPKPYGIKLSDKIKNERYVNKISSDILKDLSKELNKYHRTSYDNRYWEIITGNCVRRLIKVIFYRYKCLEKIINSKENLYTTASNIDDYTLSTTDSINIVYSSNDDEWNFNLISNILRISFKKKIKLYPYKTKNSSFIETPPKQRKVLNKFLLNIVNFFSSMVNKKKNYFIYDTYLPKLAESKLNIFLGQLPVFKNDYENLIIKKKYDKNKRQTLNLKKNNIKEVERVIRLLLPRIIPQSYLENYSILRDYSKFLKWPKSPKAILTSNGYDFDEIFKIWSASKIFNGSKYYILQHGSLHSNHIIKENTNEYKVCDKFFYWGNKYKNKKGVKAFNFKLIRNNYRKKKFKILVICKGRGFENETYDRSYEHKIIFDNFKKFINLIPKKILNNIYFRVKDNLKINIEKEFLTSKNLNIVNSSVNIFDLINNSSLVIYLYNSTGIYENLTLNIPTMFYWADSKNYRNSQNNDFMKFCKKNKIFYESIDNIAQELILKYDFIDSWWRNNKLQRQRELICQKYSILPNKKSLNDLSKKILNEQK